MTYAMHVFRSKTEIKALAQTPITGLTANAADLCAARLPADLQVPWRSAPRCIDAARQ